MPETSVVRTANPFSELAPGVFARSVFATTEQAGLVLEVRDLEVGPKRVGAAVRFKGAVVLEVRAGRGTLMVGTTQKELAPGGVVAVPADTAFSLNNTGERTLSLRLYLFTGR